MAKDKLRAYGVLHNDDSNTKIVVARLRADGLKRVGIEGEKLNLGDRGYFLTLYKRLVRGDVSTVPLENNMAAKVLRGLQGLLGEPLEEELVNPDWFLSRVALYTKYSGSKKVNLGVKRGVSMIMNACSGDFEPVREAISVLRSLKMLANARKIGLEGIVVGNWHAEDLDVMGLAEMVKISGTIKPPTGFEAVNEDRVQLRQEAYKQFGPLIEEIEKAVQS